jgi:3-hydroxyacyl-CoA dehydrogenase/enoyl-CoA hydratase/3-hydroxybutyryl-CoA epimerase
MRLFFLKQNSKKWTSDALHGAKPREVKHVAVIGGGTMGSGIVHVLIRAGYPVRLIELDANALAAGLGRVKKLLDEDVAGGRMDRLAARHAFNRVAPTTDYTGLGLVDLVIEAVIEKLDVKHQVFAQLDRLCKPDCVLATNTSSLPVTDIAKATIRPSRVVGMHFFNPVKKMPLVEIVRGEQSDDVSLATAAMIGAKIGKTPIITGDSPGFVVNRILIPYLREAIAMATEGTTIADIDETMKKWGMPMGPFELLDEIGLDVAVYVLKSLARTPEEQQVPTAMQTAIEKGWLGKKSGKGFYVHAKPTKRKKAKDLVLNGELVALFRPPATPAITPISEIPWRLVLPMINEAARVLEDRVIDSSDALDLTTVLGLGLAPFRGGLLHYANSVGTPEIVRRLEDMTIRLDLRFVPAELLKRLAAMKKPIELVPTERRQNEKVVMS